MEAETIRGLPLNWIALRSITNESLRQKYPNLSEQLDGTDRTVRNNILLTLYKINMGIGQTSDMDRFTHCRCNNLLMRYKDKYHYG